MSVSFARPDVADLLFYVYSRALHPELFAVQAQRRITGANYEATVQICEAGHVLNFRQDDQTLIEIMTAEHQLFPQHKRLLNRRIQGCRNAACQLGKGVEYQVSFQLERLEPEVFLRAHEELLMDCRTAQLAHAFPSGHRFSPNPLSLLRVDADRRSLLVHAFHTFPDSCSVVKTQSLLEF
jgi:hypothetical protein